LIDSILMTIQTLDNSADTLGGVEADMRTLALYLGKWKPQKKLKTRKKSKINTHTNKPKKRKIFNKKKFKKIQKNKKKTCEIIVIIITRF
jgi:hypothetical protein